MSKPQMFTCDRRDISRKEGSLRRWPYFDIQITLPTCLKPKRPGGALVIGSPSFVTRAHFTFMELKYLQNFPLPTLGEPKVKTPSVQNSLFGSTMLSNAWTLTA